MANGRSGGILAQLVEELSARRIRVVDLTTTLASANTQAHTSTRRSTGSRAKIYPMLCMGLMVISIWYLPPPQPDQATLPRRGSA
jgi:hypothetical protein